MLFSDATDKKIIRKRITFIGRVQRVGFRYEAKLIANRLSLTGKVRNLENGSVEVELQGYEEKIDNFIIALNNIGRILITDIKTENLPIASGEPDFTITA